MSEKKEFRAGFMDSMKGLIVLIAALLEPWSKAGDQVLAAPKKPADLPHGIWEHARTAIRKHRDQKPKPTSPKNKGFAR